MDKVMVVGIDVRDDDSIDFVKVIMKGLQPTYSSILLFVCRPFRDDFGLGEASRMHAAFPRYQVITMAMIVFVTANMIMMVNMGSGHDDDLLLSDVRGVRLHPGHHWRHHAG